MNTQISSVQQAIEPLQKVLANHSLYHKLESIEDIQVFMEHHVFAVWDFMSLLKALQQKITCTMVPWMPGPNPTLARFINEIVWGEESDLDADGVPNSHFEMYVEAMKQMGASTANIESFLDQLSSATVFEALEKSNVQDSIQQFVRFTFETIERGQPHEIAAAFTFGREDLIPDMFLAILRDSDAANEKYSKLKFYLERHIEVDGDEHGPLSLQLVSELCGDDAAKWEDCKAIAVQALQVRIELWNGIEAAFAAALV